jgi:adenylosuccinate lyase
MSALSSPKHLQPLTALTAVSPVDGRYHTKTQSLAAYFSEWALIKYRVYVEVEYLIALVELGLPQLSGFDKKHFWSLRHLAETFSESDAKEVKGIEAVTNHDVKAVEYFLKQKLEELQLGRFAEFVHFGLTSQDINNTAIPLSLKQAHEEVLLPAINNVLGQIQALATRYAEVPMLAHTHGQAASPTRLGKEVQVFVARLEAQLTLLAQVPYAAKFGGATGNFNAHYAAYPHHDWHQFAADFVARLGLQRSFPTTQIEHYDHLAAYLDGVKRINTILIDLCRDVWQYISMGYFTQKLREGEVGSSAMPHKVNPIDFENAEGNLGLANAIMEHR